jgi:hypothetical protein
MKFSPETLNILKNFANINQSILFKPGNKLRTMSPQKTVMAVANVPDTFPRQAGIYDLRKLLTSHAIHKDPEVEFLEDRITFIEGRASAKRAYSDPSMIITPPENDVKLPSVDVTVELSAEDLSQMMKAVAAYQLPEIAFIGENGRCSICALDSSNPTSDTFSIELGETDDTFRLVIKTENLQIIPQAYRISLSSKGISKFESDTVTYYIAIETTKSNYKKGV